MKRKINKKARHNYIIFDTFEAGIQLSGSEVKSIRKGNISLESAHVRIIAQEAYLINASIPPYELSSDTQYNPTRTRKLLLHKKQIISLITKIKQKNATLIPLSCYINKRGLIKIEVALARAKKKKDIREMLKRRAIERDIQTSLREKIR